MLKHIVAFKLKSEYTDEERKRIISEIVASLQALPNKIKEIKYYEIATDSFDNPQSVDIILLSKFKNEKDLTTYRNHQEHKKVLALISQHKETSFFIDYMDNKYVL